MRDASSIAHRRKAIFGRSRSCQIVEFAKFHSRIDWLSAPAGEADPSEYLDTPVLEVARLRWKFHLRHLTV